MVTEIVQVKGQRHNLVFFFFLLFVGELKPCRDKNVA